MFTGEYPVAGDGCTLRWMAEPTCHYCEQPAEAQCPSCGRLYCSEHGDDICVRCMAPEAAVPSAALYRGSIAALLLGTAVAVFLIISPPADDAPADEVRVVSTATPTNVPATSTRQPGQPTATPTSLTPVPTETPTVALETYTVQSGDTPSQIAADFGITLAELQAANPGVEFDPLAIGTVLVIPGGTQ